MTTRWTLGATQQDARGVLITMSQVGVLSLAVSDIMMYCFRNYVGKQNLIAESGSHLRLLRRRNPIRPLPPRFEKSRLTTRPPLIDLSLIRLSPVGSFHKTASLRVMTSVGERKALPRKALRSFAAIALAKHGIGVVTADISELLQ